MNRALAIIFIPAALVVVGYVVVLHSMGVAPGYGRLAALVAVLLGATWLVSGRSRRNP
jgi:uncharacterized membrane protein